MEDQYESPFKRLWRRIVAISVLLSGFALGTAYGVYIMQKEAIEHGAAGYHETTGYWAWKDKTNVQQDASKDVAEELFKQKQDEINKKCKAIGSKKKNDPACILMGE